jgi:hypothetical protein
MYFAIWALIIGTLLTAMALSGTWVRRLPVSTAMLYLAAGYALGPAGLALLSPDPLAYSAILERAAEVAVLISLFASGLKLALPLSDKGWRLPLRLASVSMTITVALIAAIAMAGFGFSLGAAVLLGAILAPTDPVLASDVQLREAGDRDRVRFSLTGEGGLNDGAAFPFVMLGLGLLGLHDLGTGAWRWLAVDVLWAIAGGPRDWRRLGYADREAGCVPARPPQGVRRSRRVPRTRAHRAGLRPGSRQSHVWFPVGAGRRRCPATGHAFCGAPIEGGGGAIERADLEGQRDAR